MGEYLDQSPWDGKYDLIGGLVGLGVYALERLPHPRAVECLQRVIRHLDEIAERRGDGGITWFTAPELLVPWQREQCPRGYYNLGLAHGVPGVIALLGEACAAGVAPEKARRLLDGAVAWLLSQKLTSDAGSSFPSWAGRGIGPDFSRLAWCYGDLGVAAALFTRRDASASRLGRARRWRSRAGRRSDHPIRQVSETRVFVMELPA